MKYVENSLPIVSLCMPTNGVAEWVFASLEKIYKQGIEENLFEVIVMDNGSNDDFVTKIDNYRETHKNLRYYHTDKALFLSEIESYKKARGKLIKFVNHRCLLEPGALQYLISIVEKYSEIRPIIYFSNGLTKQSFEIKEYKTFGEFVEALEYFSTWSSGMAIWQEDMDAIRNIEEYNYLFPHTNILFYRRNADKFIIDGNKLWDEIPQSNKPKGNYNVFYAFAVEFPFILLGLLRDGDISIKQFMKIKKDILDFITDLYISYIIKKEYCSYDLTDYKSFLNIFYSDKEIRINILILLLKKVVRRINRRLYRMAHR